MVSCHICIEQVKNPVSLPCGHIFCANCIVKSIRAVEHFTNFHPCPLCRSVYNIAPVNLKMVPPNLRAFVTPSIRRLYIEEGNDMPIASSSSDISRLQAENHALRNYCAMWQKRAEIQGSANLNLFKLANTIRDQASHLARERDDLQRHCSWLKSKVDDDESLTRGNAKPCTSYEWPVKTRQSLEPPLSVVTSSTSTVPLPSQSPSGWHLIDGPFPPSRKRQRINSFVIYNATNPECS